MVWKGQSLKMKLHFDYFDLIQRVKHTNRIKTASNKWITDRKPVLVCVSEPNGRNTNMG